MTGVPRSTPPGRPEARAGWGMPARYPGIHCRRRGRGGGGEVYGHPPTKARVGWGPPAEAYGYLYEGVGGVGANGRSV